MKMMSKKIYQVVPGTCIYIYIYIICVHVADVYPTVYLLVEKKVVHVMYVIYYMYIIYMES